MKYVADFFAAIGLVFTIVVIGFTIGYKSCEPSCHSMKSLLTEKCK